MAQESKFIIAEDFLREYERDFNFGLHDEFKVNLKNDSSYIIEKQTQTSIFIIIKK